MLHSWHLEIWTHPKQCQLMSSQYVQKCSKPFTNWIVMGWFRFFNIHMAWPLSLVQPRKVFGWDFNRGLHPNAEGLQRRIRRQREGARALFRSQLDFSDIAKESHFQEAFKTIGVEISLYSLIWRNSGKGYLLKTMLIARLQRQCRSRAEFMIAKARSV